MKAENCANTCFLASVCLHVRRNGMRPIVDDDVIFSVETRWAAGLSAAQASNCD